MTTSIAPSLIPTSPTQLVFGQLQNEMGVEQVAKEAEWYSRSGNFTHSRPIQLKMDQYFLVLDP